MSKKIKCPNCSTAFIPTIDQAAAGKMNCPGCSQPLDLSTDMMHASALAALPDLGSDGALPADLQVFPPGKAIKFTLQDYPGQEFEMDVDAGVAAKANADLQNLLSRAGASQGSQPFADKNHEDAEATFHPLRYFWGGEDPKTGGVRLVPDWTPFGASLVRAKAFKYFSQNFLFSKAKKKFLGLINENVGGLVNRPGFATQAAFAKAAPSTTTNNEQNMTTEEFKKIVDDALKPVATAVAALEAKAKAAETTVVSAQAAADNTIVEAIATALKPITEKLTSFETQQKDTLKAQAKAGVAKYVGRVGLAPGDTATIEFYEKSYLADPAGTEAVLGKLPARASAQRFTSSGAGTQTSTASTEPEDVFMAKAKAWGKENELTGADAIAGFARTQEGSELYEQFREKVRANSSNR